MACCAPPSGPLREQNAVVTNCNLRHEGALFMFSKSLTGKLHRVFRRSNKAILSIGLATGLLIAVACQVPDPTHVPSATLELPLDSSQLSEFISCRDIAINDIISIREWSTSGSPIILDYVGLHLSNDSPLRNTPSEIICKGTAIFDNGLQREQYIRGKKIDCSDYQNYKTKVWERVIQIGDICIATISFS